tara:strand:- start:19167 stop:19454 length:288 start_codon:yes stop_codon:yes gene_type:complete
MPLTTDGKPILYKPWKNTSSSKNKMWVYVRSDTKKGFKKIGFGLKGMKDFTQHKDKKRRASYLARSGGIRDKKGNLTKNNRDSANYWSRRVLWKA